MLRKSIYFLVSCILSFYTSFAWGTDMGGIRSGETRSGMIGSPSSSDSWTFYGQTGDRVIIDATKTSGTMSDTFVYLYPPDGGPSEDHNFSIDHQLEKTGLYTITVEAFMHSGTGGYNISFLKILGPASSPDDPDGGLIASGQTLFGTINLSSDLDAFQFYGQTGDRVIIDATKTSGTMSDTFVYLYPPDGGPSEDHNFSIDHQLEKTGLYTITVAAFMNSGTGGYNISLSKIPSDIRPGIYNPVPQDKSVMPACHGDFAWDMVPGATGYDLYFGEDVVEPLAKIGNNLSSPSMPFPTIETTKIYYWHVVAHSVNGNIQGPYWWFEVGASCYSLTVNKSGSGNCTVTSNPEGINCGPTCSVSYNSDTPVALTVTPDASSVFAGWSGDSDCTEGQVTMNADKSCIATCNLKGESYTLIIKKQGTGDGKVTSNPTGIDCGSDCSEAYSKGTTLTLTVIPDANSVFDGWSGGSCSGKGTCVTTLNADTTITAAFTSTQVPPKISVSPMSVNLGSVKIDGQSSPRSVNIKNTGKANLHISTITSTDAEFSPSSNCANTDITPGNVCTLNVTFSPTGPFGKRTATLAIVSNDLKKPTINVKLLGQAPPPKISVSPKSVNFGSVEVGNMSSPKIVKIKNTGTSDLKISSITITGTNAAEFDQISDCSTLANGGSCDVTITLRPISAGSKNALMSISSNDPKKPIITVKLIGKGSGGSITPAVNYFPLEVGNKWIYSSFVQGAYRNDEIIGTEIINGNTTYIKERIEPAPDNYDEKRWLAYDSSSVLIFRIWSNEGADPAIDFSPPGIEYKLSPQVGDQWSFGILNLGAENSEVLSVNDTVTVPAGTFTNCVKIKETETPSGKIHFKHYAPGVGMIRNENPGEWVEELGYAKIGLKTYGVAP